MYDPQKKQQIRNYFINLICAIYNRSIHWLADNKFFFSLKCVCVCFHKIIINHYIFYKTQQKWTTTATKTDTIYKSNCLQGSVYFFDWSMIVFFSVNVCVSILYMPSNQSNDCIRLLFVTRSSRTTSALELKYTQHRL